jgi:hypothetical protein
MIGEMISGNNLNGGEMSKYRERQKIIGLNKSQILMLYEIGAPGPIFIKRCLMIICLSQCDRIFI